MPSNWLRNTNWSDQSLLGVGGFLGMGEHDIAVTMDKLKFVEEPVRTSSTTTTTRETTTGTATALLIVVLGISFLAKVADHQVRLLHGDVGEFEQAHAEERLAGVAGGVSEGSAASATSAAFA